MELYESLPEVDHDRIREQWGNQLFLSKEAKDMGPRRFFSLQRKDFENWRYLEIPGKSENGNQGPRHVQRHNGGERGESQRITRSLEQFCQLNGTGESNDLFDVAAGIFNRNYRGTIRRFPAYLF